MGLEFVSQSKNNFIKKAKYNPRLFFAFCIFALFGYQMMELDNSTYKHTFGYYCGVPLLLSCYYYNASKVNMPFGFLKHTFGLSFMLITAYSLIVFLQLLSEYQLNEAILKYKRFAKKSNELSNQEVLTKETYNKVYM